DNERVEPVKRSKRSLQRSIERQALAHLPGQIARSDFRIVFGLESEAMAGQFATNRIMVRQRGIMDEALGRPGRKRMDTIRRHGGFCGHAGMTDGMRASHARQSETLCNQIRPADLLEDLHAAPRADNADLGRQFDKRGTNGVLARERQRDHDVRVTNDARHRRSYRGLQLFGQALEVMTGGRSQGQFDGPWRLASVDGKARGIGATITQSAEHAGNEHAELGLQVGGLEEKTHDSTHASYVSVGGFFQSPLTSHRLTHLSIQRHISFLRGNYGGRRHLDFKGVPAIGPKPSATPTTGALMRRPSTIKFRTVGSRDAIPDVDSELRTGSLAPSELPPRSLEAGIGAEVRRLRKSLDLTMAELAASSGISAGMLSKIENGAISPSLATLDSLAKALNVPISRLFAETEERRDCSFVKAGTGVRIDRRGTKAGHLYDLLGHSLAGEIGVEPYLITLSEDALPYTNFRHAGVEFLYMLSGK